MPILDTRANSFGLLRLLFAAAVIVSHSWALGGFGAEPGRADNNLGILAVEAFFALSGFLITMSGSRLTVGRFFWHRIVRIFPGFWVALCLVAGVFAPIVWRASHGLSEYLGANPPPTGYVFSNLLLIRNQLSIGDTLAGNPFPHSWNGPLYTLPFEFACYLMIGLLMAGRVLTARAVAVLAGAAWIWVQLAQIGALGASYDDRQAKFTLCFLVGSLIFFVKDRLLAGTIWLPPVALVVLVGTYLSWGFHQLGLVAFAYLVLWIAYHMPFRSVGRKRDYSYGLYIYGWPVQQLAAFFELNRFGLIPYMLISLGGTLLLAIASWHLVESRAMKWKDTQKAEWFRRDWSLRRRGPAKGESELVRSA